MNEKLLKIRTLGELKSAGYQTMPVRMEMRKNLLDRLRSKEQILPGIVGYEETVVPEIENGVLAGHHMIFLGERGQAKSRIIRSLVGLLDEFVPVVAGLRDQRRSVCADMPPLRQAEGGKRRRARNRLDRPRHALRRKACDPRRFSRGPDRRDRSNQGGRGPLPRRRGNDPLRPDPAHQSRHLRDQRAARSDREGASRTVQPDGREGRPDQGLQDSAAGRCGVRGERQSGGLHLARPNHHAAQGSFRRPDSHALSQNNRARDRDHGAGSGASAALRAWTCGFRSS